MGRAFRRDFPADRPDQPVHVIATPDAVLEVESPLPAPGGIDGSRLTGEELEAMPVLRELERLRRRFG